jgi:hypothetical protein
MELHFETCNKASTCPMTLYVRWHALDLPERGIFLGQSDVS